MKAVISSFNLPLNSWQAKTENDIAIAFAIEDGTRLRLNEEIEVDLPNLLALQHMKQISTGKQFRVRLRDCDLHLGAHQN